MLDFTSPGIDPSDDEQKKLAAAQAAQQATNSTYSSQVAQQTTQSAGGNFQPEMPQPESPLGGLVKQISGTSKPGGVTGTSEKVDYNPSQPWTYQAPQTATAQPSYSQPATPATANQTPPQAPSQPYAPTMPAGANTDGYAAPGFVTPGASQAPPGWDPTKWQNDGHQTPKYAAGRILSNFPPTVEGLQQALPDIQKAYPGATLVGRDKLNIPGVGTIDVLQGSAQGGVAWQWLDTAAATGETTQAPTGPAPTTGMPAPTTPPPAYTPPPQPGMPVPAGMTPPPAAAPYTPVQPPPAGAPVQATYTPGAPIVAQTVAPVAAPASTAPTAAPTYQAGQAPTTAAPTYQAGQAPAFNPADISALLGQMTGMANQGAGVNVPGYQAGQVSQFQGGAGNAALGQAASALGGAMSRMDPNTAAQKEMAKETLLSQRQQQEDAMRASTAGRGIGATQQAALAAQAGDAFSGALTGAYRGIEADADQQGFQNRLAAGSALSGLGQAQGANNRADFGSTLQGQQAQEQLRQMETSLGLQAGTLTGQLQNQQFNQLLGAAGLAGDDARANQATNLAGSAQQAQMEQAAAASGQGASALGLQGWQAQQQANQAQASSGQNAAQYGLQYDQQQSANANQAFQQALAAAGLNLQGQTAAANQVNNQNQFGLSNAQLLAQQIAQQGQLGLGYANMNQQGQQFNQSQAQQAGQFQQNMGLQQQQLEQQAAQAAAQMGYNYANLSQQDKQYFAQLAQQNQQFGQTFGLNSAIAGQNADNNFMQTLLGMFK